MNETNNPTGSSQGNSREFNTRKLVAGLVILIVAIVVVVWIIKLPTSSKQKVVATVNGQNITDKDVQEVIKMASPWFKQANVDLTDQTINTQVKGQALTVLVNKNLMLQDAKELGISTSTEAIDKALSDAKAVFTSDDAFQTNLKDLGLTEDSLRSELIDELTIETYLENRLHVSQVSVSPDEINTAYSVIKTSLATSTTEVEAKQSIHDSLLTQKVQGLQDVLLSQLKSKATIWVDSAWQPQQ